jgi:hypothetical protein
MKKLDKNLVYNWVIDVIHSCKTVDHMEASFKLIKNFERMFPKSDILKIKMIKYHQITFYNLEEINNY